MCRRFSPATLFQGVLIVVSLAWSPVSAAECATTDLVPIFAPILFDSTFALCQADAGFTVALDNPVPPPAEALAKIPASANCNALYVVVQKAVSSPAAPTCTLGSKSLKEFAGASLVEFLQNLAAVRGGGSNATTQPGGTASSSTASTTKTTVKPVASTAAVAASLAPVLAFALLALTS